MMLCVKSKAIAPAFALVFAACMGWIGLVQAGTDISNVAYKQPVTWTAVYQPWYGRAPAANAWGYIDVEGDAARAVLTDGITGSNDWAYPNRDGGGAWIDLGGTYDVSSIEVVPKPNLWSKLRLATVYGSSQKTTDAEYSFIIPSQTSSSLNHVQAVNWWNVRWIRIVDETDTMGGDLGNLTVSEIRVFAPVNTYATYLGGVSATATSTTGSSLAYSPNFLVNNQGMTDEHGPVGYTTAKSEANVGLWRTANLGTGGYVDQAVTFDLGGSRSLSQMRIWNYNEVIWNTGTLTYDDYTTLGVNGALIEYSQDGGNTYIALADTNGSALGNYTIPKASTSSGAPMQNSSQLTVNLSSLVADHVRLTVKSNHGDTTYTGLSEVRFYGTVVYIPGDTNNDGMVDATDMLALSGYWGASVTPGDVSKGDFNNDGVVDMADASILSAHWTGPSGEASAGAVPEPSTLVLLLALMLGSLLLRRKA